MTNHQSARHTSQDQVLKTERTDANDDAPILAWKVELDDNRTPRPGEVTVAANKESHVRHDFQENNSTENEDVITREVKSAERDFVANELSAMIIESLDDILRPSLHNTQVRFHQSCITLWRR